MYKIKIETSDMNFLVDKVRFIFKKPYDFKLNPYMSSLALKLQKNYNFKDNILSINKKDLDKVLYILNISNLIDKRKKINTKGVYSDIRLNGFIIPVSRYRDNNPKIQLRKRKSNKIISLIQEQIGVRPKENNFPKYIMKYSIGSKAKYI